MYFDVNSKKGTPLQKSFEIVDLTIVIFGDSSSYFMAYLNLAVKWITARFRDNQTTKWLTIWNCTSEVTQTIETSFGAWV